MSKIVVRSYSSKEFLKKLILSPRAIEALKKVGKGEGDIGDRKGCISPSMATVLRKGDWAHSKLIDDSGRIISLKISPKGRKMLRTVRTIEQADSIIAGPRGLLR